MESLPDPAAVTAPPARVVLADDHPAMLALATAALAGICTVVGTAVDGPTLIAAVEQLRPALAVLDITMPQLSGLDAARQLHLSHPETRLVFLTVHDDADYARAAFATGALGYVIKSRLASDLLPAIHAALAGHRFLSPTVHLDEVARPISILPAKPN